MNSVYLFVGLGGAIGAVARVLMERVIPPFFFGFPIRILFVNCIGCFLIGVLTEVFTFYWNPSITVRHFLVQGVLGGFTTFSAFALESGLLYEKGGHLLAWIYTIGSVALCIAGFFVGMKCIRVFT